MPVIPKFSYPVPSDKDGQAFSSAEALLDALGNERSGQYLVGSQGMWHGGIHITDATMPWCALGSRSEAEKAYRSEPYKGEQFIRCMADGEIVAYRVCRDYPSVSIPWRGESLSFSNSFVLVKHYIKTADTDGAVGLTFYTLYMNLAPFAAYAQPDGARARKTAGSQRYYASADDVQANHAAGVLAKNTRVTPGDGVITRSSDRRQFTEVTLSEGAKNKAGAVLAAGTRVWTVSDRGSLIAADAAVVTPDWWAKCTPAYGAQPAGRVNCKARTDWAYYLSSEDVLQNKPEGRLTADFPLSYEPGNAAQQVVRTSDSRTFSLVTLGRDVGSQKKGDRVWVVSDGDSLTPLTPDAAGGQPAFGEVVVPQPAISISAGDSIGHLGFFELPEENGKRSRYQVHIECLSMDETLPVFLTNPGKAGEQTPAFLKYAPGAPLLMKNAQGEMVAAGERKTRSRGILTLSKVPVVEADGTPAYYQIRPEGGWLAAADVQRVSQYALSELGFVTLDKAPVSFDLIDGIKHPDNVVKGILAQMYQAAKEETRTSHALNAFNYQRLLAQIDRNQDGVYSEEEYLQAVHNRSYRDALCRIIARHGSEWYYEKGDPLWKNYLEPLTKEAPLWKAYTEAFIEKITWMKAVPGMGPEPWHMHPVVFLEALVSENYQITVELVELLLGHQNPWFTGKSGGRVFAEAYKNSCPEMYMIDKHSFISSLNSIMAEYEIVEPFQKAHFLSQCLHESAHFDTTLEFGSGKNYDPGKHPDANTYENKEVGDGPKYKGRGLIQLTWKKNYRIFSGYTGIDFLNNPDDIAKYSDNSIRASCWFWRNNGGIHKKYNAKGDINILIANEKNNVKLITLAVNGGTNGLEEREGYFRKIKEQWGLND